MAALKGNSHSPILRTEVSGFLQNWESCNISTTKCPFVRCSTPFCRKYIFYIGTHNEYCFTEILTSLVGLFNTMNV